MRLALVCTEKLPVPPIRGGAIQAYIDGVAPLLARAGCAVTVFSVAHADLPSREEVAGVRQWRLPGTDNAVKYYGAVRRALATQTFDVVVVYNRPGHFLPLAAAAPASRCFLSLHNEMFGAEKLPPTMATEVVDRTAGLITVSNFLGEGIARLYPYARGKLHTVYSGVDLNRFQPRWQPDAYAQRREIRRRLKLTGRKVLLYVGRLTDKKGAHVVMRALADVATQHPQALLLVVGSKWFGGDDPHDDYVRQLRRLARSLPGRVRFTGWVPYEAVHRYYWAADVFVCASQWEEPLARVHYEAMATGVPIVTTRRGGNAEVIDGTGCGVVIDQYRSPAAFSSVLSALLGDAPRLRDMGRRGREVAEQRFGWDRVARDLWRVFSGPAVAAASQHRDTDTLA